MNELEEELLALICEVCKIQGGVPEEMSASSPLIGPESPLGTDSLDAVEIVFTVQNRYKLRIDSEETSRKVLQSLTTLADFVSAHRGDGG
ncbi:MAG: acyl carrier protein [Proteobacteria bacterium]|nr:acyl carrier protein [Pseudomonadota bacterium]MBU1739143.1 acyl carrier protein [Pseudomonadota bacterium]